jgi:phage gp29-like protein
VKRTVRVRKNGKKAIDAASSMKLPMGYSQRRIRQQAVTRWTLPSVAAFTPNYIEMILQGALAGNHVQQWELFDVMLRNWPSLATCEQELVQGVTRRELVFDPHSQEDELATDSAIEREKLVTCAIRSMNPDPTRDDNTIRGTIKDIMDAWFRGISVLEIIWQTIDDKDQGQIMAPKATAWAHPCCYGFNENGVLGLTDEDQNAYSIYNTAYSPRKPILRPFPENKFLIAIHKAKSGSPLSGPLLAPLAWWWCAANFSSDWLLNLAQVFGLPFRWANYAASSPDQTVSAICDMLANMGSAGWAAFPEGTTLELKEASKAGGSSPQDSLLDRADGYARTLILGQTMTGQTIASGRGGQAFGTVEAQGKQDRIDDACAFVVEIINQQLIPAILMLNYGNTDEAPTCRFLQETEGSYQDAQRDQMLSGLGLPIPLSHLRHKYNIPEPTGDEEITTPPPKPVAPSDVNTGPKGTRPIGQTPNGNSPSEKPRQVEAKSATADLRLEALSLIEDDEIFARELRKLASELVTGYDPSEPRDPAGTSTGGQWTSEGGGGITEDHVLNEAKQLASEMKVKPSEIRVVDMPKKWGDYNPKSKILQISKDVLTLSDKQRRYVIMHELTHVNVPNHGILFKAYMSARMSDWEEVHKSLPHREEQM